MSYGHIQHTSTGIIRKIQIAATDYKLIDIVIRKLSYDTRHKRIQCVCHELLIHYSFNCRNEPKLPEYH